VSSAAPHAPVAGKIPPRMRGIPILGNSLQLAGDPDTFFVKAYHRFGPIFKVNVFFRDYTVLAGKEAFTFFLKEKERYFSRESFYDAFARELGTEQFILGQPAHLHQHLRGQMRLAYSRQVAAEFIPRMIQVADAAIDARPPGASVVTMDFVAQVAFNQYGWVMAGRSLDEHFDAVALYTKRIMNVGAKVWPEISLKTPAYKRAHAHVFKLLDDLVRECRERPANSGIPFTVMDAILASKTDEGEPMDVADQIACVLYGFISSGRSST
jgi:cytochrome P450